MSSYRHKNYTLILSYSITENGKTFIPCGRDKGCILQRYFQLKKQTFITKDKQLK